MLKLFVCLLELDILFFLFSCLKMFGFVVLFVFVLLSLEVCLFVFILSFVGCLNCIYV